MSNGHTPGPWSVVPYGDDKSTDLVIHHSPQGRVCFMATPGMDYVAEQARIAANANLIAAAPELLEALKVALPRIAHTVECMKLLRTTEWTVDDGNYSFEGCTCERRTVAAAIAKAQGHIPSMSAPDQAASA